MPHPEEGRVRRISRACRGGQRRRLMDLGIVRGTKIQAELRNLAGDLYERKNAWR